MEATYNQKNKTTNDVLQRKLRSYLEFDFDISYYLKIKPFMELHLSIYFAIKKKSLEIYENEKLTYCIDYSRTVLLLAYITEL